ncbi:hypothetical protein N7540_005025, partial [Penicillium herquei]
TVETIAEVVKTCVDGLVECLAVEALMENEWAENRLADLNLWISGTGALARGRASLDHRLATRPEAREVVLNSLRLLGSMIDECKEASSPDQGWQISSEEIHDDSFEEPPVRSFSPWSDDSNSSSGSESANIRGGKPPSYTSLVEEAMHNVESIIDQLARLAVAIRRSGRRSRLQKADQLFKPEDHQELRNHLVTMFLHKLGLLKESNDAIDSSKLSDVQMRLIDCNLRRRNRFIYAQSHSQGLVPVKVDSRIQVQMSQSVEISEKRETIAAHGSISSQKEVDVQTVTTLRTGTSASAISASFLFPTINQTAPSASSSIMSSTVIDLDYPRPPKIMNASHIFRCPCCCESLPVAMANKNKWRKHVSDDLSPYSCVISGCDKPGVLFRNEDTWRDHIVREHSSMTYWICFACNDGTRFNSEQHFVEHTKLAHASSVPSNQISVLMDLCKASAPVEIHRCPLCNWPSEEEGEVEKSILLDHIAKELHSFSLRSLPWADNKGEEIEKRIAWSFAKVQDWMARNNVQSNPTQMPPPRDERLHVSKYFEENDYFADSSGESGTSQAESEFSRTLELRKLKQVEGSSLGFAEDGGSNGSSHELEGLTFPAETGLQGPGGSDQDPAESSSENLQNETVSTQNFKLEPDQAIREKDSEDEVGNIYAEYSRSISNANSGFLPRGHFQKGQRQPPTGTAFSSSQIVPDEESQDLSTEPYEGLDQLPWAIPQLTYTSYDSTVGVEPQPQSEASRHGPETMSQTSTSIAKFNSDIEEPHPEHDDESGGGFAEESPWRQVSDPMEGVTTLGEMDDETSVSIPVPQKQESHRNDGDAPEGPDYSRQNWADFYRPEWVDPTSGSQSLGEDAKHNSQVGSEGDHLSKLEVVSSDDSIDEEYHEDSQGTSHVSATKIGKEKQQMTFMLNGMTINFHDKEHLMEKPIKFRTRDGESIQLGLADGPAPAPKRSSNSYVSESPYSEKAGGSSRRQAPEDLRRTSDRKIDHLPDSHQSSQPWKIPELNVIPPPEHGDKAVAQSQKLLVRSDPKRLQLNPQPFTVPELDVVPPPEYEADTKEEPVVRFNPVPTSDSRVSRGQAEMYEYEITYDDERDKNQPQVQPEDRTPRSRERASTGSANRRRRRPGISFRDKDSFSDYLKHEAGNTGPIMSPDSPDSAQIMQYTDERGVEEKRRAGVGAGEWLVRRAEEEQNAEEEIRAGRDLVRHYSMDDAKPQDILLGHEEDETGKGSFKELVNKFNLKNDPEYVREETRAEPEISPQIERLSRAVNQTFENIRASEGRTRKISLPVEKGEHGKVLSMLDDNAFAATGSGSIQLKEPSTREGFDQISAYESARKRAQDSFGYHHDYDDQGKLIYQPNDGKAKSSDGKDLVTSEPPSQIPEEPGPSSLIAPSKNLSRRENTKDKIPSREDSVTSAESDETFEGPRASSSIQDSNSPLPNLSPLDAFVEEWQSRSRLANNMASNGSPARIPGEEDLVTFESSETSGQGLEDRPSSPTQPSISTSKNSRQKLSQLLRRTRRS